MKRVNFLAMLLAAGMFAACSDNLDDTGSGGVGGTSDKGYIRVALNLPTTSGANSRAANDGFNNGIEDEYKVNAARKSKVDDNTARMQSIKQLGV